jgi:hypothetical protein
MPGPDKCLLVLDGAMHPDFAGMAAWPSPAGRPTAEALRALSLGFWRAHLGADAVAAAWLAAAGGQLPGVAGQWLVKR